MLQAFGASRTLAQAPLLSGKSRLEVPVLIVGAGPTGLCTSILLSRYGIPSLLVERHASTSIYPRATGVSTRSMELLRQWGLESRVRAAGFEVVDPFAPVLPTLTGPEVARIPLGFAKFEEVAAVSPVTPWTCPQDALEPILLERARSEASAQIAFGTELTAFEQDEAGVSATLLERATGNTKLVRARYLVAADGAHSGTREQLGIAMEGPDHLADFLSILIHAELKRLIADRLHGLYFIQHPQAAGVLVPTSANDRWVFGMQWHPEQGERVSDYDRERCVRLVRTAAGKADLAVDLLGVQAFTFAAQVAQRYRKGRVFLAGDAAHRMTPSGGMGMNTGIHDAHNLAWKLAAVLKGWVDPGLLETYESERRPVGLRNTKRSDTGLSIGRKPGEASKQEEHEASWSDLEIDLGYGYESTAIIAEDSSAGSNAATKPGFTCQAGRRAPHVWLERDGQRISTLDLYERTLTLLTGSAGVAWREAAHMVSATYGVPLSIYSVGQQGELQDVDSRWQEAYGVEADGALLIRPDGFVAWRQSEGADNHREVLMKVVEQLFGKVHQQGEVYASGRSHKL
jgi:2-polyprenyl-6-methoxyphenol hydroxylase-like FAD-dependent oxidoreductase